MVTKHTDVKLVNYMNDDEEVTSNFESSFAYDLQGIWGVSMISVLPTDFAHRISGLEELEEEFEKINHVYGPSMIEKSFNIWWGCCESNARICAREIQQIWKGFIAPWNGYHWFQWQDIKVKWCCCSKLQRLINALTENVYCGLLQKPTTTYC
jgi:hypothetical protein